MPTSQKERIEYFAILRGIAILMIILTHIHQVFDLPASVIAVPRLGQLGCQIFFVISGFFAFNPLYIYRERGTIFDKNAVFTYYKKRLKRIAPGYWLTIALGVLAVFLSFVICGGNLTGISTKIQDILVNIFLVNGFVPTTANNHVVRGGWFVGTLIIFYLLTPLLSYTYQKISQKGKFILPLVVFLLSSITLTALSLIDHRLTCRNNSFFYFSFVNQISCFLLGFTLRDLYEAKQLDEIKKPLLKGLLMCALSIVLFFGGYFYLTNVAFTIIPFCVGLATVFLSCHFLKKGNSDKQSLWKNIATKFGELDFVIMLVHPFIVFDLCRILIHYINLPHIVLFLLLIPVEITIIYFVSKTYKTLINKFTALVFRDAK